MRLSQFKALEGVVLALACAAVAEFFLNDFRHAGLSLDYFAKVGRLASLFLALYTIHRFGVMSLANYKENVKDTLWLGLIVVSSVLLVWLGKVIVVSVVNYPGTIGVLGKIEPESLFYAIPYATGALLIQAVMGLHFGLVFSLFLSLIVGMYSPNEPILLLYVLTSTVVACLSLSQFRSRSAYIRAGINISIVCFPVALSGVLMSGDHSNVDIALRLSGALLNGVLCAFVAAGVTPVVEYFGGYVTDMRLIEMATLDHPLLKELSINAPGTWNHSMVMGMMVEAAAEQIGANPVVCRVGAYFHDIGKMKKPLYFVENQVGTENRHEKLSPSMSALIIRAHVKDGVELARRYKLPRVIEDLIPQHHGTNLMEYFYDKACREAKEAGQDPSTVDPSLYQYPGPKPQTREAGLLMLADGIEAAARTLQEPTLDRIQGLVQKMINKIFVSGELEESDLTLRDLHLIAKSFTRILGGIYHQRIAYAEPAEKSTEDRRSAAIEERRPSTEERLPTEERRADGAEVASGSAAKKARAGADEKGDREDTKEDLRRLGQ